jgi:tetratricopeptide (TPR) repeat protein
MRGEGASTADGPFSPARWQDSGVKDSLGLAVTTSSAAALEAYDRGATLLFTWGREALDHFTTATAQDPQLAVAHAGLAVCHFLDERFPEARSAAEQARTAAAAQSERERSHVEAVALLVTGRTSDADQAMRTHLAASPRDLIILQRLYYIWFWQGRFGEMLDMTTTLLPIYDDIPYVLGLHAFVLEEADRFAEAARAAEAAIHANARDAWAVHAFAHTLYEQASFETGITRLPPAVHVLDHLGWFRNHLLWHLALMHLATGDYARASDMARSVFERAPSSIAGDLHDSISLLWRLDLYGTPVGDRWQPFAAIARDRLDRQGLLYHAVHLAMALARGGDWAAAGKQLEMLRQRIPKDRTGLVAAVAIPLIEGMHAFARGDYRATIDAIEPLQARIIDLGGSRAQRDVYHDTLLEACFRAGDMERAKRLLAGRVARRPDHFWRTRAAA